MVQRGAERYLGWDRTPACSSPPSAGRGGRETSLRERARSAKSSSCRSEFPLLHQSPLLFGGTLGRPAPPGLLPVHGEDSPCNTRVCFQTRSAAQQPPASHPLPGLSRRPWDSALAGFGRPGARCQPSLSSAGNGGGVVNSCQMSGGLQGMGLAARVPMVTSPSMPSVSRRRQHSRKKQWHCLPLGRLGAKQLSPVLPDRQPRPACRAAVRPEKGCHLQLPDPPGGPLNSCHWPSSVPPGGVLVVWAPLFNGKPRPSWAGLPELGGMSQTAFFATGQETPVSNVAVGCLKENLISRLSPFCSATSCRRLSEMITWVHSTRACFLPIKGPSPPPLGVFVRPPPPQAGIQGCRRRLRKRAELPCPQISDVEKARPSLCGPCRSLVLHAGASPWIFLLPCPVPSAPCSLPCGPACSSHPPTAPGTACCCSPSLPGRFPHCQANPEPRACPLCWKTG